MIGAVILSRDGLPAVDLEIQTLPATLFVEIGDTALRASGCMRETIIQGRASIAITGMVLAAAP